MLRVMIEGDGGDGCVERFVCVVREILLLVLSAVSILCVCVCVLCTNFISAYLCLIKLFFPNNSSINMEFTHNLCQKQNHLMAYYDHLSCMSITYSTGIRSLMLLLWHSRSLQFLLEWHNLARLYLFSMTENMRSVIIRHKEALLTEEVKRRCNVDERRVLSAATLPELDEVYTR